MRIVDCGFFAIALAVGIAEAQPPGSAERREPDSGVSHAPEPGSIEALLAERDSWLARYADESLGLDERQTAIAQANELLQQAIDRAREDPRAIDWRFELCRSLLYQEAEPYYLSILYRGGTQRDRDRLAAVMERTAGLLALLRAAIGVEFQRLDSVAPGKYEELERKGYVDRLEGLQPKIAYMERWVKLYRALAREDDDPLQDRELSELLDDLRNRSGLLDAPHRESHVQAQVRLMAGIAARMVGDFPMAAKDLQGAVDTVRRIRDARERGDLAWVAKLGLFELVKLHRDKREYERAWEILREFQSHDAAEGGEAFGRQLAAALLAAGLHQAQADHARAEGALDQARKFENMRYEPLLRLAKRGNAARDAVYRAVYDTLEPNADPGSLHPFAGCALIAGLLADAGEVASEISAKQGGGEPANSPAIESLEARRIALLQRAIAAGLHYHENREQVPPELRSEIAYGLAVARFQRGQRLEAARGFLAIAREDPRFRLAEHAASVAVQIAAELADDPTLRDRPEVRELRLEAMKVLSEGFTASEDARYWQFFLAQTLFESGRFEEAADAYARVSRDHEYHVQAAFLRIRALAAVLKSAAVVADPSRLESAVAAVVETAAAFRAVAEFARKEGFDADQLADFLAESEILAAEAKLALGPAQATWVLDRLSGFEDRYPGRGQLYGQVLRARILAYQELDRWSEAERAIPDYVRRDPRGAGATLQGLFDSIHREIEQLKSQGKDPEATRLAASALLLAREIHAWAAGAESGVPESEQYAVDLQLAEALLGAREFAEARDAFTRCLAREGHGGDLRAVRGRAEALFHLNAYEEALPLFNRLNRECKPDDPLRYQALLRDLQCRTELNHPPDGIIKVIRQQKFLDGQMGGPALKAGFEELLKRNEERRRD